MRTKFLFTVLIVLQFSTHLLNAQSIKKEKYFADKEFEEKTGYTQAVKVGNTIYVSGTVGWGTWDKTLDLAYESLNKTLKAFGADFSNVVKENIYTMSIDSLKKYSPARFKYYGKDFPAGSWIEIKRLFNPDLLVEIEVIAVLPDKK